MSVMESVIFLVLEMNHPTQSVSLLPFLCESQTETVCELTGPGTLLCPPGKTIKITLVVYGRTHALPSSACNPYRTTITNFNCQGGPKPLTYVKNQCDGKATCSVSNDYRILGDPCGGVPKFLKVDYICISPTPATTTRRTTTPPTTTQAVVTTTSTKTTTTRLTITPPTTTQAVVTTTSAKTLQKTICGLQTSTFACLPGEELSITKVFYGRIPPLNLQLCNQYNSLIRPTTNCVGGPAALRYVANQCNKKQTCAVKNDWQVLGPDPCPGVPKYLKVDYQCVSKTSTTTVKTSTTQSTTTTPSTTSPTTTTPTTTPTTTTPSTTTTPLTTTTPTTTPTTTRQTTTVKTSTTTQATTTKQSGLARTICPPITDTLRCTPGFEIAIDYVLYGRTNINTCNSAGAPITNLNCVSTSISRTTVENYCNHQSNCVVRADSRWLGEDPCPGVPKYLQVKFHCDPLALQPITTASTTPTTPTTTTTTPTTTTTTPTSTTTTPTTTTTTSTTTSTTTTTPTTTTTTTTPTTTTTTTPTTTTTTTTPTTTTTTTPTTTTTTTPTTTSTTRRTTPTSTRASTTQPTTVGTTPSTTFPPYIPFKAPANIPAGSQVCHDYLVSGAHGVPDSALTSSSQWNSRLPNDNNGPERSRLFTMAHDYGNGTYDRGAWSSAYNDKKQYIQVELGRPSLVKGIVTQGRHVNPRTLCCIQRVTQYKVMWSKDGINWNTIQDQQGIDLIFPGNIDDDSLVTNMLDCPIIARYIRILPQGWTNHIAMRFDVLGCQAVTEDLGKCPNGWLERSGSDKCYLFTSGRDSLSWDDAKRSCMLKQGHLVDINSVNERDFVLREINRHPQISMWWIGLNNKPRKDTKDYKWLDGKSLDTKILNWKKGEPNNGGYGEHCAEFWNRELNDDNCDNKRHYICEKDKYWTTPVNKPSLPIVTPPTRSTVITTKPTTVSTKPTPPPTYSTPTTVTINIPTQSGVTVVTNQQSAFYTGCVRSFADCLRKLAGDYHSCKGCSYYITCASSGAWERNCPNNLRWDDNVKRCEYRSSTCKGP